jgi:hypothetical protein
MRRNHSEKSILELAEEIKALADSIRRPEPVEECNHEWEYVPAEYESLSGRGTVLQYPDGNYCAKCDQYEEEL